MNLLFSTQNRRIVGITLITFSAMLTNGCAQLCMKLCVIGNSKYSAAKDGETITLKIDRWDRFLTPIAPDGPFPKIEAHYEIKIRGKGKNYSYMGFPGYYYSHKDFPDNQFPEPWYGYIWVDKEQEHIYINIFEAVPPDSHYPMSINGKYDIHPGNANKEKADNLW